MKVAYIIINGIHTNPGRIDGWPDRMVTALNTKSSAKAQAAEYHVGALDRRVGHQRRVRKVAKMIGYYQRAGYEVHIVAHSNGAFVAADVLDLRDADNPETFFDPVESLQLFAPAVDWWELSGNLDAGDVARIRVYWSENDKALALGRVSRRLFGWLKWNGRPLGYGSLGLDPSPLAKGWPDRVAQYAMPQYGHSTWFTDDHFDRTVQLITAFDATGI